MTAIDDCSFGFWPVQLWCDGDAAGARRPPLFSTCHALLDPNFIIVRPFFPPLVYSTLRRNTPPPGSLFAYSRISCRATAPPQAHETQLFCQTHLAHDLLLYSLPKTFIAFVKLGTRPAAAVQAPALACRKPRAAPGGTACRGIGVNAVSIDSLHVSIPIRRRCVILHVPPAWVKKSSASASEAETRSEMLVSRHAFTRHIA
mgnify:FL=1